MNNHSQQQTPGEARSLQIDDWTMVEATAVDIDALMDWFPNQHSVAIWGGPDFRYPYTRETFHEDVRWSDMASFCLRDPDGKFVAFGQVYDRIGRMNLARLVVHADCRGQGAGKRLISLLMLAARPLFTLSEYSLFVYRDNIPAHECYKSMGFEAREYPEETSLGESCLYLTRPASIQE